MKGYSMKKFAFGASLAAAAFAMPVQAEVVSQGNGAFVTRDSAVVEADVRTAWLKLIAPGEWWDSAHTWSGESENMMLTPQGGGCFCERIPGEDGDKRIGLDGSVQHMVVLNAAPDRVLRMRGGLGPLQSEPVDGVLTIALSETDEGTLIVFEYVVGGFMRFETPVIAKAVDGVMTQQLDNLAETLGRVDAPAPDEEPAEDEASEDSDAGDASDGDTSDGETAVEEAPERISVDEAFGEIE